MNAASALCLVALVIFLIATTDLKAVRREMALDEMDFAQEQQVRFQELMCARPIQRAPRRAASLFCVACSDPIPEARRAAVPNCERCVHCQAEFEGAA